MLLIGHVAREISFNQSEAATTEILLVNVTSKEFLQSLLRRHFAQKPLVALQNFGCFLRLTLLMSFMKEAAGHTYGGITKSKTHDP